MVWHLTFQFSFAPVFSLALKDRKVEVCVKDGSPQSLSAVNKHGVLTGSIWELASQLWLEVVLQKVCLHYKPQSVVFIAPEYYFQPWQGYLLQIALEC